MKEWILASASPRRRELLGRLGYPFRVMDAQVDEGFEGSIASEMVEALARRKASAVAERAGSGPLVIAADTVVVLNGEILGKPGDEEGARRMLRALAGQWHEVMTGLCLIDTESGRCIQCHEITRVRFGALSEDEIDDYIATREPMDKAGAYGIQGQGALLVERIEGCYYNVVGLPLYRLKRMLTQLAALQAPENGDAIRCDKQYRSVEGVENTTWDS